MCSPQDANSKLPIPEKHNPHASEPALAETKAKQHPTYWFDDATLVLAIQDQLYKIHQSLLSRLSPFLKSRVERDRISVNGHHHPNVDAKRGLIHVEVEHTRGVTPSDVDVLLGVIYHDISLTSDLSFNQIASLIRASSPTQLDLPAIHALSVQALARLIPSGIPTRPYHPEYLVEAISLAADYQIQEIKKPLLYSLLTIADEAEPEEPEATANAKAAAADSDKGTQGEEGYPGSTSAASRHTPTPPPQIQKAVDHLMERVISHFTPILYTPSAGSHMNCTDVFAEHWMELVIAPSLSDGGVYRAIESLERLKGIDWKGLGMCESCVKEKEEEWTEEQENIWKLVDGWLEGQI
ncbi:hypothetical protein AX16_000843 [Volvariella volvacea WC 439]|nr:hypothetical protein AX16_000843 [Volvariella volvacea WC 439]